MTGVDWMNELCDQLEWHWTNHVRPRLDGLTDEEYFWEPAPGCWNVRPRAEATTPMAAGAGDLVVDYQYPEPSPPPVTTIAWRMAHVLVGVFGLRTASHFGGPEEWSDYSKAHWPASADAALAALDATYGRWIAGVRGLGEAGLGRAVGPAEGAFAESPYASLVLHINREAIHHLAEILLLRDLYRATGGRALA